MLCSPGREKHKTVLSPVKCCLVLCRGCSWLNKMSSCCLMSAGYISSTECAGIFEGREEYSEGFNFI